MPLRVRVEQPVRPQLLTKLSLDIAQRSEAVN
jgi:hypothetical protein